MIEKAKEGVSEMHKQHSADMIIMGDKKELIGGKYTSEEVYSQIDSAGEIIKVAVEDNKKFPRQAVKAFLTNDYLADMIKQQKVLAEYDPKANAEKSLLNPGISAISQAVASLVSKAQAKGDEATSFQLQ